MITIGKYIKEKRMAKKLSLRKLGQQTRIRENFISAIEEEKWDLLPEKAVVTGFVKSLAGALEINLNQAMALFRRDYPQKPIKLNPTPDLPSKFIWSPRLTFILGSLGVFLLVSVYLMFQYINFVKAPGLTVFEPSEGQVIVGEKFSVKGETDPEATVIVNNQPAVVSENGKFETELEVDEKTSRVQIIARSRTGKETVVVRGISVKLQ